MMNKVPAVLAVLAVSCFGSLAFAAHDVGNVDVQPIVGGQVDVYGAAKFSVDLIDTGGKAPADTTLTKVSSNSSRIGFKGADDLGNGLWATYQLELGITMDANAAPSLRNTFVGLTKSGGTLLFGIHDTPYKLATGSLDPFGDTMGDYNAIIGNVNGTTSFDLRNNNTFQFQTPTWGGFHLMGATSTTGTEASNGVDSEASAYSAAVVYRSSSLYATVAYELHKNGTATVFPEAVATTVAGTKLGVGYVIGETKIGFVFETLSDDKANSAYSRDAVYVSAAHKLGKETIKLAYGSADDGESTAKTGATFMAIGIDHSLSKRTTVYAVYAATKNDKDATYGLGQGQGGAYKPGADEDPSVLSFGINHIF